MQAATALTAAVVNLDFSVCKNFAVKKISEASAQFRAGANIMNHANFAALATRIACLANQSGWKGCR
jgi:hypothetical protein